MIASENRPPLVVLGSGSWGTALALYGATQFEKVILWGPFAEEIDAINAHRENKKYIPGVKFPSHIESTTSLNDAFSQECILVVSVPSHVFIQTIEKILPFQSKIKAILIATKGVSDDGQFLHELTSEVFTSTPLVLLSGPSFAKEVACGLPTSVTFAGQDKEHVSALQNLFHTAIFRVYPSDDMRGVAIGGVVKNVLAIAVGLCEGLGFGANARAAMITSGLHEMKHLIHAIGGNLETVLSLAALGDTILTTTDNQSRNRRFGLALGQGKSVEQAEQEIGQVVEGKHNVKELLLLAERFNVEMPISQQVYQVIFEGKSGQDAMTDLLNLPVPH